MGTLVGVDEGSDVGEPVGRLDGEPLGTGVGAGLGTLVGSGEGTPLGTEVGTPVGQPVGSCVLLHSLECQATVLEPYAAVTISRSTSPSMSADATSTARLVADDTTRAVNVLVAPPFSYQTILLSFSDAEKMSASPSPFMSRA